MKLFSFFLFFYILSCSPKASKMEEKNALQGEGSQISTTNPGFSFDLTGAYSEIDVLDMSTESYRAISLFAYPSVESNYIEYAVCEKTNPQNCFPSKRSSSRLQIEPKFIPVANNISRLVISVRECEPLTLDFTVKNCGPWKEQDFTLEGPNPVVPNFTLTTEECYQALPQDYQNETLGFYSYYDSQLESACEQMVRQMRLFDGDPRVVSFVEENFSQSSGTNCYEIFAESEDELYYLLEEEEGEEEAGFGLVSEDSVTNLSNTVSADFSGVEGDLSTYLEGVSTTQESTIRVDLPLSTSGVASAVGAYPSVVEEIRELAEEYAGGAEDGGAEDEVMEEVEEGNESNEEEKLSDEGLIGIIVGVSVSVIAGIAIGASFATKNRRATLSFNKTFGGKTSQEIIEKTNAERDTRSWWQKLIDFFKGRKKFAPIGRRSRGAQISAKNESDRQRAEIERAEVEKAEAEFKQTYDGMSDKAKFELSYGASRLSRNIQARKYQRAQADLETKTKAYKEDPTPKKLSELEKSLRETKAISTRYAHRASRTSILSKQIYKPKNGIADIAINRLNFDTAEVALKRNEALNKIEIKGDGNLGEAVSKFLEAKFSSSSGRSVSIPSVDSSTRSLGPASRMKAIKNIKTVRVQPAVSPMEGPASRVSGGKTGVKLLVQESSFSIRQILASYIAIQDAKECLEDFKVSLLVIPSLEEL